jgi:hypothetical protein
LVRAIVDAFCPLPRDLLANQFAAYRASDWNCIHSWLDTNGLEFYFLAQIAALGLESFVPQEVRTKMEGGLAANRARTAKLFDEFVRVNSALSREALTYSNVKGIALVPASCPDATLRRQVNLDIILAASEFRRCRDVLDGLGYTASPQGIYFCEFRPTYDGPQPDTGCHSAAAPPPIGVYLVSEEARGVERAPYTMLLRRCSRVWNTHTFPVLTEPYHFVAQAIRVLGQIGTEWTRLGFLLEFRNCVRFWLHDDSFWSGVIDCAKEHPLRPVAIATAVRLAAEIFGGDIPLPIERWVADTLDVSVQRWAELYGWDALLTDFPDNSLHELLYK